MKRKRSAAASVLEFFGILLGAILVAFLIQAFIVKPFQIPTPSMVPTIDPGDRILVNRLSTRFGSINRGDIIVFKSPQDPETDFVKRVIAVGGDTVEIDSYTVIVNGEPVIEDYINSWTLPSLFPEQTVPEGKVFVMGDNRDDSQDARFWNPPWLDEEDIIGKAFMIYWPPSRIGLLQ